MSIDVNKWIAAILGKNPRNGGIPPRFRSSMIEDNLRDGFVEINWERRELELCLEIIIKYIKEKEDITYTIK